MSARRIMPDATLLPDGTVFIANGADTGIAGGRPGAAGAANLLPGDPPQSAETYNISAPFGSRMSGLLASSGRDRLYHCVSWLTPNAEMLVTGSEATSDYTMQVFTPGYLRGTFARRVLFSARIASLQQSCMKHGAARCVATLCILLGRHGRYGVAAGRCWVLRAHQIQLTEPQSPSR